MHQLDSADSLLKDYKGIEKEETVGEKILDAVSSEEWKSPDEIYKVTSQYDVDFINRQAFSRHLQALVSLGELETKGKASSRQYRKADKPVQETREDYSSPLSEGIPDFMERRIEEEVEKRVKEEVSNLEEMLEQKVKIELDYGDKNKISTSSGADSAKSVEEMILPILKEAEEGMNGTEVKEEWDKRYNQEKTKRTVRRYLNRLADRGLVTKYGSGSGTEYILTSQGVDDEN